MNKCLIFKYIIFRPTIDSTGIVSSTPPHYPYLHTTPHSKTVRPPMSGTGVLSSTYTLNPPLNPLSPYISLYTYTITFTPTHYLQPQGMLRAFCPLLIPLTPLTPPPQ